jgi:hypothetical protein
LVEKVNGADSRVFERYVIDVWFKRKPRRFRLAGERRRLRSKGEKMWQ